MIITSEGGSSSSGRQRDPSCGGGVCGTREIEFLELLWSATFACGSQMLIESINVIRDFIGITFYYPQRMRGRPGRGMNVNKFPCDRN